APIIAKEEGLSKLGCGVAEVAVALGIGKTIWELVDMVGGREKGGIDAPPSFMVR
ncbi:hypothetical protein KI387_021520, partial [Taxus chinensis]